MKKISFLLSAIGIASLLLYSCNSATKNTVADNAGISTDSLELACEKLQKYVDNNKLAGISAMVVKDNNVVLKRTFGYADIENKKPVEENTIFRVYSMTKPITAAALMTLYDEGKFQLDDEVAKYIPEFENTPVYNAETKELEPQETKMTIRHLLTHTSGLTYGWDQNAYVDSIYRANEAASWDTPLSEQIKVLGEIPLKHQPGTTWEYSVSIDVAGYLCEVLSGMPLDEFFKTRIFDPLKMDDAGFYVPESEHSRLAVLYNLDENGALKGADNPNDNFKRKPVLFSGGGGLVATIDDYAKFGRMLLNGGELDGVRVLQESTVDMIMSNQLPEGVDYENGSHYGLGGSVNPENGSYGWSGAASTHFVADPENKMVILALTQLMPFDVSYAHQFVEDVENAVIK